MGHQLMVEADLSKLIHNDSGVLKCLVLHQAPQERGLAASQEPRQQEDR
jgi:hypothetical protein